jgi:16S rRNA processing protein RimM
LEKTRHLGQPARAGDEVDLRDELGHERYESLPRRGRHREQVLRRKVYDSGDDPEEYYDRQLRGLRVLDASGVEVGVVADVVHLPSQDLLSVTTATGERLVPFVTELVPEVDLAAGTCRLAEVTGLLEDPDEA